MTRNEVIQSESIADFETQMNAKNVKYGKSIFATQTHVTPVAGGTKIVYTAIFFIRDE